MEKAAAFQKHSKSMADTASSLAKSGVVTDRKMADELIRTAGKVQCTHTLAPHILQATFPTSHLCCTCVHIIRVQVKKIAPQVEYAARIVLDNPDNEVRAHTTCI